MLITKKETVIFVYKANGKDNISIKMEDRELPVVWERGLGHGFESFAEALHYINKEYPMHKLSHICTSQFTTYE